MSSSLLARFAENLFWLARYMERAENLARILQVTETFARDRKGEQDWLPVVQLNSDEDRFFAVHDKATADKVIHFYVADPDNPTSIRSSVSAARENARSLRHIISTEMWTQLNVFDQELRALRKKDLALTDLSALCQFIKESCQTHHGITEGTFYRDEGWHFYQIGRYLERADQTSRLLDIRYRVPSGEEGDGVPDPTTEASQWNTLLRCGAGYHAFRRVHPRGMKSEQVAAFFLFDRAYPRSIGACAASLDELLRGLKREHRLIPAKGVGEAMTDLRHLTRKSQSLKRFLAPGIHARMDEIQQSLAHLTTAIGQSYFGYDGP